MLTLIHINNHPLPTRMHHKPVLEVLEVSRIRLLVLLKDYHHQPLCRLHLVICQGAFRSAISAVVEWWQTTTRWTKRKKTTTVAITVLQKTRLHPSIPVVVDSIWEVIRFKEVVNARLQCLVVCNNNAMVQGEALLQ
jgi:hypothetical protein